MSIHRESWFSSLAKIPTRFHLWCAERELRLADTPGSLAARARSLGLLRAYRKRGEFPANTHDRARLAQCFVDASGRQCAVAFLMTQTGAKAAANKVAAEANFARIAEMDFPELETWAIEAGLTKEELARIQPGYPPTPAQVAKFADIMLSLGLVGALAFVSIVFNTCRLIFRHRPRLTTLIAGIVAGFVLCVVPWFVDSSTFSHTHDLSRVLRYSQIFAYYLGLVSVVCGIIPFFVKRQPILPDQEPAILIGDEAPAQSDHVKVLNEGNFRSVK